MFGFKFIHCADLHLGSRSYGVTDADQSFGKRMTDSIFVSFSRIVDRAMLGDVNFMVISGDIFDETSETPATRYKFAEELKRVGIPVFLCLGNHDHTMSWTESIPYPENVHVFGKEPENIVLDVNGESVEIIGRSFPSRHSSMNPTDGIRGKHGIFSIAVLHCNLAEIAAGEDYGPCKLSDMIGKGVDYWALGHIHKRSEVCKDPYVIYPGNIQGRHSKESGEKGAYVVTVNGGHVEHLDFFATQEVLWQDADIDITGVKEINALISMIKRSSRSGSVLKLILHGNGILDPVLRKNVSESIRFIESGIGCKISELVLDTYPEIDRDRLSQGRGLPSLMIASSDRLSSMNRQELIDTICSTKQSENIKYMLEWLDDDQLRSLVHDAEAYLMNRMSGVSK